jgi:hypothetical protein
VDDGGKFGGEQIVPPFLLAFKKQSTLQKKMEVESARITFCTLKTLLELLLEKEHGLEK